LQRKKPRLLPSKHRTTRPPKPSSAPLGNTWVASWSDGCWLWGRFLWACMLSTLYNRNTRTIPHGSLVFFLCFSSHTSIDCQVSFFPSLFAYTTKYNMWYAFMNLLLGYAWIKMKMLPGVLKHLAATRLSKPIFKCIHCLETCTRHSFCVRQLWNVLLFPMENDNEHFTTRPLFPHYKYQPTMPARRHLCICLVIVGEADDSFISWSSRVRAGHER